MSNLPADWLSAQIIAGLGDAVIFADREGIIRLWNGGAERMFGYSADEALGQTLDLIVPERLRERHWTGFHHSMETGQTRYANGELLAVPAINKAGERLSIEFSIALVMSGGALAGVGAVIRDVSVRWQQERDLRARLAKAEALVMPENPPKAEG